MYLHYYYAVATYIIYIRALNVSQSGYVKANYKSIGKLAKGGPDVYLAQACTDTWRGDW